jgi:hypothetical protein
MAPQDHIHATPIETTESHGDEKLVDFKGVDEAFRFVEEHAGQVEDLPHVDEKRLMRKVDWMLMPLMFACYYLQYSDKTLRMLIWESLAMR